MTTTWTAPNYSPGYPVKRYVRAPIANEVAYKWFEVSPRTRYTVCEGTTTADELPPKVKEEADALRGLAFGCVDWPH